MKKYVKLIVLMSVMVITTFVAISATLYGVFSDALKTVGILRLAL